jgi:hypothetical protein
VSAPDRKGMGLGDALLLWFAIGFIVVFGGGTYAARSEGTHPSARSPWAKGVQQRPRRPAQGQQ